MTAQTEPYSEEERLIDMLGEPWDRLFGGSSGDDSAKAPLRSRRDDGARVPSDVKRLPIKEMSLFGRCPETDPFITVVCSVCGCVVMPHAFRRHMQKRHMDDSSSQARPLNISAELKVKTVKKSSPPKKPSKAASLSPPEFTDETDSREPDAAVSTVCCSLCATVVNPQAFRRHVLKVHGDDPAAKPLSTLSLKVKTAKKPTPPKKPLKSASSSPPELTEEHYKDQKKLAKSKKCKSPIPPELEPILPAAKRIVLSGSGPPELMPIELPKKTSSGSISGGSSSSSKKKLERKADKVYDPNKHCGVINDTGKPCLRSILCKVHLVALKRAVQNRAMPYDALTKLLKSQNDEEKKPKVEVSPIMVTPLSSAQQVCVLSVSTAEDWSEPPSIKQEEPPAKRLKTEEVEEDQYALPSDLDALIEETLKDVEANEPLPVIPVVPRPEPIVRWSLEPPMLPPASCSPPPHFQPEDILWHATHPRPLATHTYGCRLLGGLLSTNKKGYAFRKNVQSVLTSRSGFSDSSSKLPGFSLKTGLSPLKKHQVPQAAPRRKRKGSSGAGSGSGSSASDLFAGILRAGQPATNGVPLRLFQGSVQQPTFIQFNLCPSK